ncbi:unnamed protein product [Periconia digitata]|uniref:WKF domain-containing protein n=1 Tax=Periconia digitata TaxID=1303443 RepID=A0A9W4UF58_9PLEO|nr:unnamed protein product [Periconia digitata]
MAQPSRIPAWKRLGLKLQDSDQSAEHHSSAKQDNQPNGSSRDQAKVVQSPAQSSNHPADINNSHLGKRKHEHEPAETNKKSKNSKHQTVDSSLTRNVTPPAVQVDKPESPKPASDARPKGDSNYRKKKPKRGGGQRASNDASSLAPVHSKVNGTKSSGPILRTPSLSPGYGTTLLASTETDHYETPMPQSTSTSPPPSRADRRKSVTFTPDTKTVDGNSAANLFKKWVKEQKTAGVSETEISQFVPPPKIHPANDLPSPETKNVKKSKKAKKAAATSTAADGDVNETAAEAPASAAANPKKDPSRYLDYLTAYHTDRPNWKFNKAKQNDVLNNALNIFRIPEDYSDALIAYVQGLQGAGVIQRLKQQCTTAIEEIEAAGTEDSDMDDPKDRQAAQDEALKDHLTKQRKRRRLDRDVENMVGHPYTEGYIRRLKKNRAQALVKALNIAEPAPAPAPARANVGANQKVARNKKRRSDISSDESSDSSSSEKSSSSEESSSEESSSEEESSDDDSDSESSDSSSSSESEDSD